MSSCFLDILPELHWKIFHFCCVSDLINLACTSSQWNSKLKIFLWRTVKIPTASLLKRKTCPFPGSRKKLRNLKYTEMLYFSNEGTYVERNEKTLRKWEQEYTKILKCCDHDLLKGVQIEGIFVKDSNIRLLRETCTNLTKLTLVGIVGLTTISFDVLENITHISMLSELTLDSCSIGDSDLLRISRRLSSITLLDVRCTFVTDDGLFHLLNLRLLKKLVLNQCRYITDKGISYISHSPRLAKLYLFHCRLGDNSLRTLSTMKSLRSLDLASTCIADHGLTCISRLASLQHLDLSSCQQVTDHGMHFIAKLSNLTKLHLYQSNLTDLGLSYICDLPAILCLDIGSTNVTDKGLRWLSKLVLLEELDISSNPESNSFITDVGVSEVLTLKSLRVLDMGWLNVSDDSLATIENCSSLTELSVIGCSNLTDMAMKYVAGVKTLTKLDITSTNITDIGLAYLLKAVCLRTLCCWSTYITELALRQIDSKTITIQNRPP